MVHYPGYDANKYFIENEWSMRDEQSKVFMFKNKYFWYNHSNSDFREWWIKRALDIVSNDEIDGIFIDAIMKTTLRISGCPDNTDAYWQTAKELRQRLPDGKLLIGNALRPRANSRVGGYGNIKHLQYLDGSYMEGWLGDADTIVKAMELMSNASMSGRIIMLNAGPVFNNQEERIEMDKMKRLDDRYTYMKQFIDFPLAIYLIIVDQFVYFSYHYNVDAKSNGRNGRAAFDCYQFYEIKRKLGKPKGEYKRNGYIFTREFEYLSVFVNVASREARLTERELLHDEL